MENEAQNADKVRKEMQSKICTYSGQQKLCCLRCWCPITPLPQTEQLQMYPFIWQARAHKKNMDYFH